MKRIIFLGCLVLFLPAMVFGQEKVEAPVWNVGDKWVFDREGPMEVIGCDAQCYSVKFSGGIFPIDASGIAIFDRSTLNVKYILERNERKEYRETRKKIFNFPLTIGKQWTDVFQRERIIWHFPAIHDLHETFEVLDWQDVEVRAGKFRALKLEYKLKITKEGTPPILYESRGWYWYSPEVRNFVKCQYEMGYDEMGGRKDWELVSYELKK
jgi:hypothetical protein